MDQAYVKLRCPECGKEWEATPMELPDHDQLFRCPDCDARRQVAEFARTERDLETLKTFGE